MQNKNVAREKMTGWQRVTKQHSATGSRRLPVEERLNMQTEEKQSLGQLITLSPAVNGQFLIKPLTQSHVSRDFALTIAKQAAYIELGGARQSLFIHDDGTLELWEPERATFDAGGMAHLMEDAEFIQCDTCGRKSWGGKIVGDACSLPQPSGEKCVGRMTEPKATGGVK